MPRERRGVSDSGAGRYTARSFRAGGGGYTASVPTGARQLQAWPGGAKYLIYIARPERFELPTRGQVAQFLLRVVSAVAYWSVNCLMSQLQQAV